MSGGGNLRPAALPAGVVSQIAELVAALPERGAGDEVDRAQALEADLLARSLARISADLPTGTPGECDECGELMPRVVGGRCGFCRDGRRPPAEAYDAARRRAGLTATPTPSPASEEEKIVANPQPSDNFQIVSVRAEGAVIQAIRARATADDVSLGRAAVLLIEEALAACEARGLPVIPAEAPVTAVSLATVPAEWLTEEIARRMAAGVPAADFDAVTARAEAAEGRLESLRQALLR